MDARKLMEAMKHRKVMLDVELRLASQKRRYPTGFTKERNSIRLGIAAIQDETKEMLDAWYTEKKDPEVDWYETYDELMDIIAVALYLAEAFHA